MPSFVLLKQNTTLISQKSNVWSYELARWLGRIDFKERILHNYLNCITSTHTGTIVMITVVLACIEVEGRCLRLVRIPNGCLRRRVLQINATLLLLQV